MRFSPLEWLKITKSVLRNFAIIHVQVLPFLNNPKNLNQSYKRDLDFWDCFGRKKNYTLLLKKYNILEDGSEYCCKVVAIQALQQLKS